MTYTTLTIIAIYFNIQSYTDIYRVIRIYCITGFFQGQHISQISRNLGQFMKITDTEKNSTWLNSRLLILRNVVLIIYD